MKPIRNREREEAICAARNRQMRQAVTMRREADYRLSVAERLMDLELAVVSLVVEREQPPPQ